MYIYIHICSIVLPGDVAVVRSGSDVSVSSSSEIQTPAIVKAVPQLLYKKCPSFPEHKSLGQSCKARSAHSSHLGDTQVEDDMQQNADDIDARITNDFAKMSLDARAC